MRVVISPRAGTDLREIEHYIALDSPRSADRQIAQLQAMCQSLADSPTRFAVIRKRNGIEVRRAVQGRYSIFYVVRPTEIYVARILHAARDLRRLFGEPD
jgi:toxin ParE1/3/4